MKKKGLPLIIALVCLLVLCAGYVCLVKYNDKQEKADSADTSTVLNLKVDDVSKIAYEIDGEMVSFTKDADKWTLDSDAAFEADADKVTSLISSITSMTATRKIEDVSDLSEYGLDAPGQTVTLTDADGVWKDAVFFGEVDEFAEFVSVHDTISVTYYPEINEYQGRRTLQIVIRNYC